MLYGSLDGRGVWGRMDTCTCMAEPLCGASETIRALLTGYKLLLLLLSHFSRVQLCVIP